MADEPSPSEFLISKMEGMDDVTQVLIVTRTGEGEISYDSCGQIAADTLGMIEFVRVAAAEHLRRELYDEDVMDGWLASAAGWMTGEFGSASAETRETASGAVLRTGYGSPGLDRAFAGHPSQLRHWLLRQVTAGSASGSRMPGQAQEG